MCIRDSDSPEIPDRGETSDIPGLPSGVGMGNVKANEVSYLYRTDCIFSAEYYETVVLILSTAGPPVQADARATASVACAFTATT